MAMRRDKNPPARAFDAVRLIAISRSLSLPNKEVAAILLAANTLVWPFDIVLLHAIHSTLPLRLNNFAAIPHSEMTKHATHYKLIEFIDICHT